MHPMQRPDKQPDKSHEAATLNILVGPGQPTEDACFYVKNTHKIALDPTFEGETRLCFKGVFG